MTSPPIKTTPQGSFTTYTNSKEAGAKLAEIYGGIVQKRSGGDSDFVFTAAGIGAAAAVVSAGAAVGSFCVGLADSIRKKNKEPKSQSTDAMEVLIVNASTSQVVPYGWVGEYGDITKVSSPLLPGESNSFLITKDSGFTENSTNIQIGLLVGDVAASAKLEWTNNALWKSAFEIDGENSPANSNLGLFGAVFTGDDASSFGIWVSNVETSSGAMQVIITDAS